MLGKLLVFAALLALAAIIYPLFFSYSEVKNGKTAKAKSKIHRLFTVDELKRYDGSPGSPGLLLAILGEVFDVEKGRKFYGPNEGYSHFSGKDGTRAFLTGEFTPEGLRDDVLDLSPEALKGLQTWIDLYHKDYKYAGRLVGRYFDDKGRPTQYLKDVKKGIKTGFQLEKAVEKDKQRLPPCNAEWAKDTGSRVWCTTGSGGIQRTWVGVPRQMFSAQDGGMTCVCASESEIDNPHLKEYNNCPPQSTSCSVQ